MHSTVAILLIIALVKSIFFGVVLLVVFRPDLRKLRKKKARPDVPTCMYCQSKWTRAIDEGQTRWDNDDLVLVTTYECEHCHLPFWHVERVPTSSLKR
jgi:hypothetical protein